MTRKTQNRSSPEVRQRAVAQRYGWSLYCLTWHGVLAPAGTPAAVVAAANAAFAAMVAMPDVRARRETTQGAVVVGGPPEAFGRFIADESAQWGPVVRAAGIRAAN
ncbi:tripartite tricarboxylate transporter substrate-binding protein [Falsiroseomonas selenitidurans]|uniref:tripartite tricarboxylate transporter substrate-binding protein n=1 Tax=Falsiroseomonas selenitidurans TaxID=2716335 RepID=UPI0022A729B5|nr:tripartite tricarboxylate transporter substrate-binding protein [Falsiroseomonas selenitidurans]